MIAQIQGDLVRSVARSARLDKQCGPVRGQHNAASIYYHDGASNIWSVVRKDGIAVGAVTKLVHLAQINQSSARRRDFLVERDTANGWHKALDCDLVGSRSHGKSFIIRTFSGGKLNARRKRSEQQKHRQEPYQNTYNKLGLKRLDLHSGSPCAMQRLRA